MVTTLGIVLAALIVLNIWLGAHTAKKERERRRALQERMDEYDEFLGEHMRDMGNLKLRLDETTSELSKAKKLIASLQEELKSYKETDPHAGHQDPVDGGSVNSDVTPTEPKLRKVNLAALDLQDLRKSYDELAKRYENPSKTYLVRNIVKVYDVQSRTQLAKALGVSQQSINQMLRKK